MAKKRVHELAKEFGLENKEVIKLLQQAGISVKTHSSSVYEDEARAVLGKTSESSAPAPKKRPGMMIVRKKKVEVEEAPAEKATPASEADPPQAPSEEAAAVVAPEQSAVDDEDTEVQVKAQEKEAEEIGVAKTAASEEPGSTSVGETGTSEEDAAAETASGEASPAAEAVPEDREEAKTAPGAATVVRMIDRDKLLERVPSNRLGGDRETKGGSGGKSFGQVTELKVVHDPFGRGREMIAVDKDRRGKGGKAVKRGARMPAKRDFRDMRERNMHPARLKRKKSAKSAGRRLESTQPKASKRVIKMKETIQISELGHQLGIKATELVRKLMGMGMMVGINASIDFDTAQLLAGEYEYTVESVAFTEESVLQAEPTLEMEDSNMEPRPPVVTVMGHVDHGKTSLLDAIRKAKVAAGEAGGITQHIGAYSVEVKNKGSVTFIDTPGHAAFTEMRARGAQVTDIVILVVAADDGVMPQTEEAIKHSQAAGVPIIVAVNKVDRPESNPEKVMQELTKYELVPEAWGGDTLFVQTSAIKRTGLDELLDAILLQAEVLDLKASREVNAIGVVVEAKLDKGRGPVATLLVQHGVLQRGDNIVVGEHVGKIRAMTDYTGKQVKKAGPADAVEIIGLEGVPDAGDKLHKVESAEQAREVAQHRIEQKKAQDVSAGTKMSLDDLMRRMSGEEAVELKIVLKGDVQGSVEAVRSALSRLSTDEVKVNVIFDGVGGMRESDIMLASASNGLVVGFNVRPDSKARTLAQREGVEIRSYSVIYELIDDVKKAMEGLLTPESQEKIVGRAEVREVFKVSKVGSVAGSRVLDGQAKRSARVRVLRDSVQIYEGKVGSLRHFKDDVREVDSGQECGIGVEGFNDVKQGDVIEFYEIEEVARKLDAPRPKRSGESVEAHP